MLRFRKTAPGVANGIVQRKNRRRKEADYRPTPQIRITRDAPVSGHRHFVTPGEVEVFLSLLPDWAELSRGLDEIWLYGGSACNGIYGWGFIGLHAWPSMGRVVLDPNYHEVHSEWIARLGVPCRRVALIRETGEVSNQAAADVLAYATCLSCGESFDEYDEWHRLEGESEVVCASCCEDALDTHWSPGLSRRFDERGAVDAVLADFNDETVQAFLLLHVLLHELGHHHDRMTSPKRRQCTRGERYADQYAFRYAERIWSDYCRVFRFRPGGARVR